MYLNIRHVWEVLHPVETFKAMVARLGVDDYRKSTEWTEASILFHKSRVGKVKIHVDVDTVKRLEKTTEQLPGYVKSRL